MKTIFYNIALSVMILSCASDHKMESVAVAMEEADIVVEKMAVPVAIAKPDVTAYETLATKKLQELYDLKLLQGQHPEFTADIDLQLKKLKEAALRIGTISEKVQIKNVVAIVKQKIDSVEHLQVQFDLVTTAETKKDTITARIKRKRIQVDGQSSFETKLLFIKE